jgi:hypothetical protein
MQDQGVVVGDEIVGAHIVGDSREAECLEMGLHHPRIGSHPLQGERRLREPAVELPPAAALGRADEAYRGRNVCSRGALQRVDEGRTALALPGLAAPQAQLTVTPERAADLGQVRRVVMQRFARQHTRAEAHLARAAVGNDVDRVKIVAAFECRRDLCRRPRRRGEHDRLDVRSQTGQQRMEVEYVLVDKDDFSRRGHGAISFF